LGWVVGVGGGGWCGRTFFFFFFFDFEKSPFNPEILAS
jgi:hypothetical protein